MASQQTGLRSALGAANDRQTGRQASGQIYINISLPLCLSPGGQDRRACPPWWLSAPTSEPTSSRLARQGGQRADFRSLVRNLFRLVRLASSGRPADSIIVNGRPSCASQGARRSSCPLCKAPPLSRAASGPAPGPGSDRAITDCFRANINCKNSGSKLACERQFK